MNVTATVHNRFQEHQVMVTTKGVQQPLHIEGRSNGYGSTLNGAELLLAALATCFCNDIYREAALRGIMVQEVKVEAFAIFGAAGECGSDFRYRAYVKADASEAAIDSLVRDTDRVAEIHNTLRRGVTVTLDR